MTTLIDHTDPTFIDEMHDIVAETLGGLLESGAASLPLPDVVGHEGVTIESIVLIVGDGVSARLVVRIAAATAIALTSALTDDPVDTIDLDDALGTMSELCNVLGGTAKTLIDDETALAIPISTAIASDELDALTMIETHHELAQLDVYLASN